MSQSSADYTQREVDYGYVGDKLRTLTDVLDRTTEFDYDSLGRLVQRH